MNRDNCSLTKQQQQQQQQQYSNNNSNNGNDNYRNYCSPCGFDASFVGISSAGTTWGARDSDPLRTVKSFRQPQYMCSTALSYRLCWSGSTHAKLSAKE